MEARMVDDWVFFPILSDSLHLDLNSIKTFL